jgi:LPS O-antigen subunit length determinant protein (WzzB/FepE family)
MKTKNILLLGALALVGYMIYKRAKKPKASIVEPQVDESANLEDKKTIVLDLRQQPRLNKRQRYLESFQKGYDARQQSTIAPPMVTIKPFVNDL